MIAFDACICSLHSHSLHRDDDRDCRYRRVDGELVEEKLSSEEEKERKRDIYSLKGM